MANQTLHEAKRHHQTTIKIHPSPVRDFRFLAFSDESFATKTNSSSHTGMLIMGTHKVSCPVSVGSVILDGTLLGMAPRHEHQLETTHQSFTITSRNFFHSHVSRTESQ